jgi:uncharacterized membrane protein YhaH (DUF805 family)
MTIAQTLGRPSVWSEFFTFRGRTNRGRYWLIALILLLIAVGAYLLALAVIGTHRPMEALAVIALLYVPLLVPAMLAAIRRLHDRDKSGHWLWLFIGLPAVLNGAAQALEGSVGLGPALIVSLVSFALSFWGFVEMGCLRGTVGPNRFGGDPLQSR